MESGSMPGHHMRTGLEVKGIVNVSRFLLAIPGKTLRSVPERDLLYGAACSLFGSGHISRVIRRERVFEFTKKFQWTIIVVRDDRHILGEDDSFRRAAREQVVREARYHYDGRHGTRESKSDHELGDTPAREGDVIRDDYGRRRGGGDSRREARM